MRITSTRFRHPRNIKASQNESENSKRTSLSPVPTIRDQGGNQASPTSHTVVSSMPAPPPLYGSCLLTNREYDVIRPVALGLTNRDAAAQIGMKEQVLKNHLCVIFNKLGVWNRVELALWYQQHLDECKIVH